MLIFAFKLFVTPLLIGAVTLAGRRWGAITSGLLIGLPLTSGPISFILACQYGLDFVSRSAVGNLADDLGPKLSGLVSPFPAFSVIFAAFTHAQQGAKSASNLLRGVIVGSGSYAFFFLVVGLLLNSAGIAPTYLLASGAAVACSGLFYLIARRLNRPH
jgi:hypothetical protein